MSQTPPNIKVQRAKVVITVDGKKLILKHCGDCNVEFYGTEVQMKCEKCRGRKKRA